MKMNDHKIIDLTRFIRVSIRMGRYRPALNAVTILVRDEPDVPKNLVLMATVFNFGGRTEEAIEACEVALTWDHSYFPAYYEIARAHHFEHRYEEAIAFYENANRVRSMCSMDVVDHLDRLFPMKIEDARRDCLRSRKVCENCDHVSIVRDGTEESPFCNEYQRPISLDNYDVYCCEERFKWVRICKNCQLIYQGRRLISEAPARCTFDDESIDIYRFLHTGCSEFQYRVDLERYNGEPTTRRKNGK